MAKGCMMVSGWLAAGLVVGAPLPTAGGQAWGQVTVRTEPGVAGSGGPVIIVPQGRNVVIWPEPGRRPPALQAVRLTSVETSLSMNDQVASTTLVMTLTNPGHAQQEAQVLLPVPDGASVKSFMVDGMGGETAQLLPREEARRIYDSIVSRSRDPGLLEFVGYGVIKSSVFPVPARGTQVVRLTYEQLLPADGNGKTDRIDYVLPRTESLEATGVSWSFNADIRSTRPLSTVYSPSHEIAMERISPNHARVRLMTGSLAQPGAFRLSCLVGRDGDGPAASVYLYPDPQIGNGKGGYFLLLAGMPAKLPEEAGRIRREVTVAIDRSGSMRGAKMEQAREAALQVVEGLAPGEFFNIIDYSDSIASFAEAPVEKTDETMRQARAYLKGIQANGGTNIHDAVVEALRPRPAAGTLPVVLFLTDGLPTVGQTGEKDIREAAAKANAFERRIFTFGVGFDVNAPLLTGLARATRATSTFVLPEEDVEVKVGQVYRRLSGPVLAGPKLGVVADPARGRDGAVAIRPIREVQPAAMPDVFEGDQVVVLGQYLDDSVGSLSITGNYLGRERSFEFSFDPERATVKNSFVPRLWASRKIGALIEQIRLNAAGGMAGDPANDPKTKELVDEIVRLSTKWGILTEYTAFLAVEPGAHAGLPGGAGAREIDLAFRSVDGRGGGGVSGNMDLLERAPARVAAPSASPEARAGYMVTQRAAKERAGKVAVNQELNLGAMVGQSIENRANIFYDKDMNRVQVMTVRQVGDQTLFRRSNRWVDAGLIDREAEAPERTVEFASVAYMKIVDELAARGRQGVLAEGGDCLILHNGERVLVKGPGAAAE